MVADFQNLVLVIRAHIRLLIARPCGGRLLLASIPAMMAMPPVTSATVSTVTLIGVHSVLFFSM